MVAFPGIGSAQYFGIFNNSARSLALGRSDIADVREEWNPNPAIPSDTSSNLRLMLLPLPYNLPQTYGAGISGDFQPDTQWSAGGAFSLYQASSIFSWESFGLQTSRTFLLGSDSNRRRAVAGIRFRYNVQQFGTNSQGIAFLPINDITFDLGATFDIISQLTLAVAGSHLATISNNQNFPIEFPTAYIGLSYRATNDFTVDAAFEASNESHPGFHAGAEYGVDENIFVRAGDDMQTGSETTNEITAGVGILAQSFRADFAATHHSDLGTALAFDIELAL